MQGTISKGIYAAFAALLEYPREDIKGMAQECVKTLEGHPYYPSGALKEVKAFLKEISEMPLDDLQGIYSYTFEISGGEFTLDLGYHLYDGFKRANNLVTIKTMYREQGFPFDSLSKGELPDYLPVVLKFLDFVKDDELKRDFRESYLIKALEKLSKNFDLNPVKETPYRHLIKAVTMIVDKDIKMEEKEKGPGFSA